MISFTRLLSSIFLAIAYVSASSSSVSASSSSVSASSSPMATELPIPWNADPSSIALNSYRPPAMFKSFGGEGIDHPLSKSKRTYDSDLAEKARKFIASELCVDVDTVSYQSGTKGEIVCNAYLAQSHDGIPFANAVANVAIKGDKVVSYGSSFVKCDSFAPSTPTVRFEDALSTAEKKLGGKYSDENQEKPCLNYVATKDAKAVLTYSMTIHNNATGEWYQAYVDAHDGELVSLVDYVAHATYLAVPISTESIGEGGQVFITDPENLAASPLGWSDFSQGFTDTTQGNNVGVSKLSVGPSGLGFDFPVDLSVDPTVGTNVDAARVNAFYVINSMHDITYLYGFTETAFNFQNVNFDAGGIAGDPIVVTIQRTEKFNDATFATRPEGTAADMQMFLFNYTTPFRDASLDNTILIHEFGHGLSNRLTGGGTARCLQGLESEGLGEGLSDSLADWVTNGPLILDFSVGVYATGSPGGARAYPYSTNPAVNPLRYSALQVFTVTHEIGQVWANILHNILAALVTEYGYSFFARTDASGSEGNVVFLHLFVDALQLQPCYPTFLTARDAWYQADTLRYGGANRCLLQRTFASRGLGLLAAGYVDDETVDADCL